MLLPARCDWCRDEYVTDLVGSHRCPVCREHTVIKAQRRREKNYENWLEWAARKSEERR